MAHHSSGLEGNTITLPETVNSDRSITLQEIYEIANHEQAFDYLFHEIINDQPFT